MIDQTKHAIEIIRKETVDSLRNSQRDCQYVLPSDYFYFLITYGKMRFSNNPEFIHNNDRFGFYEFYDLENCEWQVKDKRNNMTDHMSSYWSDDYICIGQLDDKRLLIGVSDDNINEIYLFDNEETYIEKLNTNLFEFINDKLVYQL
jgi:hypothetical protein